MTRERDPETGYIANAWPSLSARDDPRQLGFDLECEGMCGV